VTGPLRQALDDAMAEHGGTLRDFTAMSPGKDPFRLDTPANHRDGKWLADTTASLGVNGRTIHLRGLHYALLGQARPDGSTYVNDDDTWQWLQDHPGKMARWLGYIGFDQFTDHRNAAPVVRLFEQREPEPYLSVGVEVDIPDAEDFTPEIGVSDFVGEQAYKLVLVGEKSSLDVVLGPIAERYQADLYLPTGDISDTLIYQMAQVGADDGRPMVVFYFADADPAGWNMGIVIARKLQALKVLHFPDLEFQVRRVALTPAQVREFNLPSTPLKATERRADKWRQKFDVEQTEIDALATLQPELLRSLARDAIGPFFDATLARRVAQAKAEWCERAQTIVDNGIDQQRLASLQQQARDRLTELRTEIDAINDAMRLDVVEFDLPPVPPVPEASPLGVTADEPLLDSGWTFAEQCQALIESRAYDGEATT
jgi:hypothetical protein